MPNNFVITLIGGACALSLWCAAASAAPADTQVRARADALIAKMTPEEKASQLTQYFYLQPKPEANKVALQALENGGVGSLLFVTDPAEVNRLQRIAVEKSRLKIPVLVRLRRHPRAAHHLPSADRHGRELGSGAC